MGKVKNITKKTLSLVAGLYKSIIWLYNSYIWNPLHLWWMKKQADQAHKETGKRYFVVPATENRCMVVDNTYIKYYNRQKGVKKINIHDLIKMAYYATSTRSLVNG